MATSARPPSAASPAGTPVRPSPPPARVAARASLLGLPAELLSHIALLSAPAVGPPSLLALALTHRTLARALSFDGNPTLYASLLARAWDIAPARRRFGLAVLADARSAALELRHRWGQTLRTVRAFADDGARWLEQHGQAEGVALLEQTMLEVFFLLTENDGRNLPHLLQWARLVKFCLAYHTLVMLPASVAPGYPAETLGHGLHNTFSMWFDEAAEQMRIDRARAGLETGGETEDQTQEKMFVLRPFAFALQKYNPFFAPWNTPVLPLSQDEDAALTLEASDAPASGEPRPVAKHGGVRASFTRFGKEWCLRSTLLNRSSVFGLLNALDRDPRVGGVLTDSSNSSTASLDFIYTPAEAAFKPAGRTPTFDPVTGTALRRSVPVLHLGSAAWDTDVRRMILCADLSSPGLKLSDWRGKFEGEWQGSFAFFDFNGYRDMLAGDDKALFENCFGQQGQQLLLHEEVVYVPRAQLGGPGSALHCGFPLDGEDAVVCRPCPVEEEALDDAPGSEWVKELMIHGTGRSNWGSFRFRGRVRAFDGLMTLLKEYASDVPSPAQATRGNWLYRGYVTADSRLVGTWRDTFSPEDVSGYEGPFSLRKQSDAYLLPDVTSIKPDTSLASFVETMRSNMGEPVPTALPPQTASLTTAAVFASTAADVLETLNKLKPDEADRSGAAAAAVSEGRKQRLLEAKLSTPNSPAALSPVAREPSADGRLPFIYPGFTREESERWDEHKARIHDSWGTAVYNEIKVAFDSAGHTSTRDLPPIIDMNLKRERPDVASTSTAAAAAGPSSPPAAAAAACRKRKVSSPAVEDESLSKADGKRPEHRRAPSDVAFASPSPAEVGLAACTPGQSVFKHTVLARSQSDYEQPSAAHNIEVPVFRPSRNRSVRSLLRDSPPPAP